jgi:predicted transcriptional regulator
MRVEEIMSSPVVVVQPFIKVEYLKDLFSRKNINAVPVLESDGKIIGIVSSNDVAKCQDNNLLVEEIMTSYIHIVKKNNRVSDAAAIMVKHKIHHLVVMDEGQVVGMLSSFDILKTV